MRALSKVREAKAGLDQKRQEKTGFKGVGRNANNSKPFEAYLCHDGKKHYLGVFATAEEAALTYASVVRTLANGLEPYLRSRKRRRPPAPEPPRARPPPPSAPAPALTRWGELLRAVAPGAALVGRRVRVWWEWDRRWFLGTIDRFVAAQRRHCVLYDDGDERDYDLLGGTDNVKWEFSAAPRRRPPPWRR